MDVIFKLLILTDKSIQQKHNYSREIFREIPFSEETTRPWFPHHHEPLFVNIKNIPI